MLRLSPPPSEVVVIAHRHFTGDLTTPTLGQVKESIVGVRGDNAIWRCHRRKMIIPCIISVAVTPPSDINRTQSTSIIVAIANRISVRPGDQRQLLIQVVTVVRNTCATDNRRSLITNLLIHPVVTERVRPLAWGGKT